MNSKESQKIQAVIDILNREEAEIQAAGETENKYYYWYDLIKARVLLEKILEAEGETR